MGHQVPLHLGSSFSSYSDLEPLLQQISDKQFVPFTKFCSLTVEAYNKKHGTDLPARLKYESFTYGCKHYGKRREKSKGIRCNQSSFKMECKARIRFKTDQETMKLVVTAISLEHTNHTVDPLNAQFYPENRKLSMEEEKQAAALMDLEVNPAILQNVVRTSTFKCVTLQDLRNSQQRIKNSKKPKKKSTGEDDAENQMVKLLEVLEEEKKNDPNGTITLGSNDQDEVEYIFWASSSMKDDYAKFPEVLGIDNTYNTNNTRMPLAVFVCQDNNGNGKVAGYCLMKSEKMDVLRESLACFVDCYSSVIHKTRTIMVDKDMNEISRIYEILPEVDVVLCRFHNTKTFNSLPPAYKDEPNAESIKKITKNMLYVESEKEYAKLYDDLRQVASEDYMTNYFDKHWHNSRAIWKGHERLECTTLGVTTTNSNESKNGHLKKVLNRKRTLPDCVEKLMLCHHNFTQQGGFKEFSVTAKVHYKTNCKDPTINEIVKVCRPYVAKLIVQQLEWSKKMDALPASKAVNTESCNCAFFRSRMFPCVHMFFSRRLKEMPLFAASDVNEKWRLMEADDEDEDDPGRAPLHPPPVFVPSCPVKTGGAALTKAQKFSKFLSLCSQAGEIASLCGGEQFLNRCNAIESMIKFWERNVEVSVTPIGTDEDVSLHKGSSSSEPDDGGGNQDLSQNKELELSEQPKDDQQINCRCGLPALCFVPKFGLHFGKTCYRCPKKLPEVPCKMFTVKQAATLNTRIENDPFCIDDDLSVLDETNDCSFHYSTTNVRGIKRHDIGFDNPMERPTMLKLPPKIIVKGHPKMGVQRSFRKGKLPQEDSWVTGQDARKAKAASIPDKDVWNQSNNSWQVQSQSESGKQYTVRKELELSTNCTCITCDNCVHCFSCDCMDKIKPCKHMYKVKELYDVPSIYASGKDMLPDDDLLGDNFFLNALVAEISKDEADGVDKTDQLISNNTKPSSEPTRTCPICTQNGPPTNAGAHKCVRCGTAVHAFGCSTASVGGQEGSGGTDRLCWTCFDKGNASATAPSLRKTLANSQSAHVKKTLTNSQSAHVKKTLVNNQPSSSPVTETSATSISPETVTYHCFGCKEPLDRLTSKSVKNFGREFFGCRKNATARCKPFLFWRPRGASMEKEKDATKELPNWVLSLKSPEKNPHSPQKTSKTPGSILQYLSPTKQDSTIELCPSCRLKLSSGHVCKCHICGLSTGSAIKIQCYRCERDVHMDQCGSLINAPEKGNESKGICMQCLSNMTTRLSKSMINDIEQRKMLSDETIHLACSILSHQFKETIDGLHAPLALSDVKIIAKENFYKPMNDKDYVQIMYTGSKHWVTMVCRNESPNAVIIDSLKMKQLTAHLKIQIAMIMKSGRDTIDIERVPSQQQTNCFDCGVFAIAHATEYCFNKDLDHVYYDATKMRSHLLECLRREKFELFPRQKRPNKKFKEDSYKFSFRVFCDCRLPDVYDNMLDCDGCGLWFHKSCMGINGEPGDWMCWECSSKV